MSLVGLSKKSWFGAAQTVYKIMISGKKFSPLKIFQEKKFLVLKNFLGFKIFMALKFLMRY